MLTHIQIKDFALIRDLSLEFGAGFNVITGETGAGKSILVGALSFVLGTRLDNKSTRRQNQRTEVTAVFDISGHPLIARWLAERDLDAEGECVLRRVITRDGRSQAYLNGTPVTLQTLRESASFLVSICGQHAQFALLQRHAQRQFLDDFSENNDLLNKIKGLYQEHRELSTTLNRLQQQAADQPSRLATLDYLISELDAAREDALRIEALTAAHRRAANLENLQQQCEQILQTLDGEDPTAVQSLNHQLNTLRTLEPFDKALSPIVESMHSGIVYLEDAISALRRFSRSIEYDPAELAELDDRLSQLFHLARKHRISEAQLPEHLEQLRREREHLINLDQDIVNIHESLQQVEQQYQQLAETLSTRRREAAARLSERITQQIRNLGMTDAQFLIDVRPSSPRCIAAHGIDEIEFLFNANLGGPVQPLTQVASGGELSRLTLALHVATNPCQGTPCLVFDEVDAGISGRVADAVGQLLNELARSHQVFCVTHLPQVASLGHHHFRVAKQRQRTTTRTTVTALHDRARSEEIARMLGGEEITAQTRAHAAEMLARGRRRASPASRVFHP